MEYKHLKEIEKLLRTKETRDLIDNLTLNERKTNVENFKKLQEIIGVNNDVYSEFIYALLETEPDILTYFDCIPDEMFSGMDWLDYCIIPKNIKSIGDGAFENCTSLKHIFIEAPSMLNNIGDCAFLNCEQLLEMNIPRGVQRIGDNAFEHCESMRFVKFNDLDCNLKTIGAQAFARCSNLCKMKLPKGLKTIEIWAFLGCENLQEMILPETVNMINGKIFIGCDKLVVKTKNPYVIDYCKANDVKYVCIP